MMRSEKPSRDELINRMMTSLDIAMAACRRAIKASNRVTTSPPHVEVSMSIEKGREDFDVAPSARSMSSVSPATTSPIVEEIDLVTEEPMMLLTVATPRLAIKEKPSSPATVIVGGDKATTPAPSQALAESVEVKEEYVVDAPDVVLEDAVVSRESGIITAHVQPHHALKHHYEEQQQSIVFIDHPEPTSSFIISGVEGRLGGIAYDVGKLFTSLNSLVNWKYTKKRAEDGDQSHSTTGSRGHIDPSMGGLTGCLWCGVNPEKPTGRVVDEGLIGFVPSAIMAQAVGYAREDLSIVRGPLLSNVDGTPALGGQLMSPQQCDPRGMQGKLWTCFMHGKASRKGKGYLNEVKLELVNERNQLDGLKGMPLGFSLGERSLKPIIRHEGVEQFSWVASRAVGEFASARTRGLGGSLIYPVAHTDRDKKHGFDQGLLVPSAKEDRSDEVNQDLSWEAGALGDRGCVEGIERNWKYRKQQPSFTLIWVAYGLN
ncbi:unnamed protein product [Linum trigynum]|uniref:Uncharacterized protein n=1 Tax=Linum trigynum TaxID=586398 RepID=A0AAV2GPW8_9ROSI